MTGLPPSVHLMVDNAVVRSQPLSRDRLARAKSAYTTRRVDFAKATRLIASGVRPRAGDLVLARVERIGQHGRIELANGRRAQMHVGDEIIVCYGARYAPDQFEAYVPDDLDTCDLVAAGGIAARCDNRHASMKRPTRIRPLALLADANDQVLNLDRFGLATAARTALAPYTVVVVGTAMNAGKTTAAANLVRGLIAAGARVGSAKVTGTGAGGDRWSVIDAGAAPALDFTDAGVPSTFGLPADKVLDVFEHLHDHLAAAGVDVAVIEVADGLLQAETAELVANPRFQARVDSTLFAAGDALGATAGVQLATRLGLDVIAVTGALTASPLAIRETRCNIDLPVVSREDLASGDWLPPWDATHFADCGVLRDRGGLASVVQAHG